MAQNGVVYLSFATLHFGMGIVQSKHKRLGRFCSEGLMAGMQSKHATRLRLILGRLSVTPELRDMERAGLGLHPHKGARHGTRAVSVSGKWCVMFRFKWPNVTDVDYEDYH